MYGILGLVIFVQALRSFTGPERLRTELHLRRPDAGDPRAADRDHHLGGGAAGGAQSIREAGYGVGATRWEVVRSHVLPYAAPGIFTGTVLSLARAFGETAPLLLVGAVTGFCRRRPADSWLEILQGPYTALPTLIFSWAQPRRRRTGRPSRPPPSSCCSWSILVGEPRSPSC